MQQDAEIQYREHIKVFCVTRTTVRMSNRPIGLPAVKENDSSNAHSTSIAVETQQNISRT
jgi:hypothetical protein